MGERGEGARRRKRNDRLGVGKSRNEKTRIGEKERLEGKGG
jgi:hypothetical protein